MAPAFAAFVFAFLAGFILTRLGRNKPLRGWEHRLIRPVGWVLMAASLTLAVVLIGWALLGYGRA